MKKAKSNKTRSQNLNMPKLQNISNLSTSSPSNYLKIFFDLDYFLLLSPFRLNWRNGVFRVERRFLQQLFCGILWLLSFPWLLRNTRKTTHNAKDFLLFIHTLINSSHKLVTIFILYTHAGKICSSLNLFEKHSEETRTTSNNRQSSAKKIAITVCTILTLVPIFQMFAGKGIGLVASEIQISSWSLEKWWTKIIRSGNYNYYLETNISYTDLGENRAYSSAANIVGILSVIGYFSR